MSAAQPAVAADAACSPPLHDRSLNGPPRPRRLSAACLLHTEPTIIRGHARIRMWVGNLSDFSGRFGYTDLFSVQLSGQRVEQERADLIRGVLAHYLAATTRQEDAYQALARRHRLLPILPEWTGFVGLREDGALFWVSDDDGSVSTEINEHARHLATIRGPELFPELAFLKPTVAPDWVVCSSCGGSGKVIIRGQEAPTNVRCLCGGMGKVPPHLAHLLRAME
jgi:hypothetical protein